MWMLRVGLGHSYLQGKHCTNRVHSPALLPTTFWPCFSVSGLTWGPPFLWRTLEFSFCGYVLGRLSSWSLGNVIFACIASANDILTYFIGQTCLTQSFFVSVPLRQEEGKLRAQGHRLFFLSEGTSWYLVSHISSHRISVSFIRPEHCVINQIQR